MRTIFLHVIRLITIATLTAFSGFAADLQLTLETDHRFYPEGRPSELFVEARIVVEPSAIQSEELTSPRNVVIVMDRSGSMSGEPIQFLRAAVLDIVASLSARDTLAIVAFGSEVETLIPANRVDKVREMTGRIAQIEAAGGSALYDALSQGAAQIRRFAASSTSNDLVLITDGPATKGPREFDDFRGLVESFARDRIRVSTIGLGKAFDEDLLSMIARTGNGRFSYCAQAGSVAETMAALVTNHIPPVVRDLSLTVTFKDFCNELDSHGSFPAETTRSTITYQIPYLGVGQTLSLISSARIKNLYAATGHQPNAIQASLTWSDVDPASAKPRDTLNRAIALRFAAGSDIVRGSVQISAFRGAVDALIQDGMQEAIEQIDEGDLKHALKTLQRTRTRVRELTVEHDDEGLRQRLNDLDTYLTELESRGLSQLDRKILRSGVSNQFDSPSPEAVP